MSARFGILILAFLWAGIGSSWSIHAGCQRPGSSVKLQQSQDLANGPLQAASKTVQKVLRLKQTDDGKNLALDKSAWKSSNGDKAVAIADQIKTLRQRGLDPAAANRLAFKMSRSSAAGPLSDLFSEFRLHGMSSVGQSQLGGISKTFCQGPSLNCTAIFTDSSFEFVVNETDGQQLSLLTSAKRLRMMLLDEDVIVILNQSNTGKISAVLTGQTNTAVSARDFREFHREHPVLWHEISTLFRHAGVDLPPSPNDEQVEQKVVSRIRSQQDVTPQKLNELIQQLDANEFNTREIATQTIVSQFDRFESWIVDRLDDGALPIEAKKRLDKIVQDAQNRTSSDPRIDQCIESYNLLSSPNYLVGLLAELAEDDQNLVILLLADLTNEKFGQDIDAWQAWAKEQSAD